MNQTFENREAAEQANAVINDTQILTEHEKDAIGEIGNICMGTSATTLSQLLCRRVTITTPRVSIVKGEEYLNEYERPVVATEVAYTKGLDGKSIFLIKKEDALAITEVLIGSSEGVEELYLSAISEVMNQMVGSSSTALADILHVGVNIAPPVIRELTPTSEIKSQNAELMIKTSFKLDIEGLLSSNLLQIMTCGFGKELAATLIEKEMEQKTFPDKGGAAPGNKPASQPLSAARQLEQKREVQFMSNENNEEKVALKDVKFQSFNEKSDDYSILSPQIGRSNIDLIIDVPLQVTVVLGKTKKSIKDILEFGRGSVIVLDRLAGEMVDVLVNGKLFARGEVVVIDDNYGVRITEITSSDQIKNP